MLYHFGKFVTYILVRILFRMRYEGLENIPQNCGFILACNHRSNFDPLFIAHKVKKPVRYMAKAELFRIPVVGLIIKNLRAFPVERGSSDQTAIETAESVIKNGEVLGMFPEGKRSKDGTLLRPRSGVALITAQTHANVLPCAVCFGKKLSFRTEIIVRYGKMIPFEALNVSVDSRASIRAASGKIMQEIRLLLENTAQDL